MRRSIGRYGRAVSNTRLQLTVAAVALAVIGLVVDIAAGSGLIGTAAPAAAAPPATSHSPAVQASVPPGHSAGTGAPHHKHLRLAASPQSVPRTTAAAPRGPSGAAGGGGVRERHPRCAEGCKKGKPHRRQTTTKLVAAPSPATVGGQVTLTATEEIAGGGHVAGRMHFEVNEASIGPSVAVNADGVATVTTTLAAPGTAHLSAEFLPASAAYAPSKGTFSLVVHRVPANVAGVELISVTVPRTGAFTVSIQPGPVQLTPAGSIATGRLPNVTVTDTRNYSPGWSLSGQAASFSYSRTGKSVSGNELGWAPAVVGSLHGGAKLGRTVAPARPGLGAAPATLAYAPAGCGFGTNVLSADLTLDIPRTSGGHYDGTVTITYVESLPASSDDDQAACTEPSGHKHDA